MSFLHSVTSWAWNSWIIYGITSFDSAQSWQAFHWENVVPSRIKQWVNCFLPWEMTSFVNSNRKSLRCGFEHPTFLNLRTRKARGGVSSAHQEKTRATLLLGRNRSSTWWLHIYIPSCFMLFHQLSTGFCLLQAPLPWGGLQKPLQWVSALLLIGTCAVH